MDDDEPTAEEARAAEIAALQHAAIPQEDGSVMPPIAAAPAAKGPPDEFAGFDPVAGAKPAATTVTVKPPAAAAPADAQEPIKAHIQIKSPVDNRPTSQTLGFADAVIPPVVKFWQQAEASPTGKGLLDALSADLPPVAMARQIAAGPLAKVVPAIAEASKTTRPGGVGEFLGNVAPALLAGESKLGSGAMAGWMGSKAPAGDYLGQLKDAGVGAVESLVGGKATEGLLAGIAPKLLPAVADAAAPVINKVQQAKAQIVGDAITRAKLAGGTAAQYADELRALAMPGSKTMLKNATPQEMAALQDTAAQGARQTPPAAAGSSGLGGPMGFALAAMTHQVPGYAALKAGLPLIGAGVRAVQNRAVAKSAQQLMTLIQTGGAGEAKMAGRQLATIAANHPWVAAMIKDAGEWTGAGAASTAGQQRQAVGQ
jgi:hypothetical protein